MKPSTAAAARIALLLGSAGLSLLAVEWIARSSAVFAIRSVRFEHVRLSENPRLLYEFDAEHPGHNSAGLRGPELAPTGEGQEPEQVLALGDSPMYELEVRYEESPAWGSSAPIQVGLTECLLSDIAEKPA